MNETRKKRSHNLSEGKEYQNENQKTGKSREEVTKITPNLMCHVLTRKDREDFVRLTKGEEDPSSGFRNYIPCASVNRNETDIVE